jgi:hypothetical protein
VASAPTVGGNFFTHTGSNTFSIADVLVSPDINRAYLVATNRASDADFGATVDTILALHELD